jgi:hypothetical protein
MIENYFCNGRNLKDECPYSVQHCLQEFKLEFPQVVADYKQFQVCLDRIGKNCFGKLEI